MLVVGGAFALVEGSPRRSRHLSKQGSKSQTCVTKKGSRKSKSEKVSQLSWEEGRRPGLPRAKVKSPVGLMTNPDTHTNFRWEAGATLRGLGLFLLGTFSFFIFFAKKKWARVLDFSKQSGYCVYYLQRKDYKNETMANDCGVSDNRSPIIQLLREKASVVGWLEAWGVGYRRVISYISTVIVIMIFVFA